jgi:hypothetical protein
MFNVPFSKVLKKEIKFSVQPKQIVYIGDYEGEFRTFIWLSNENRLYTYRNLSFTVTDNFETVKTKFIEEANDKTKEKINALEFVSAL